MTDRNKIRVGLLYRYVKQAIFQKVEEAYDKEQPLRIVKSRELGKAAFELRPEEGYVSLVFSKENDLEGRAKDCLLFCRPDGKVQARFGIMELKVKELLEDLNDEDELISFHWQVSGRDTQTVKHAGLFYHINIEHDYDLILTSIAESLAEGSGTLFECERLDRHKASIKGTERLLDTSL